MSSILQALYSGELRPAENVEVPKARRLFGEQEQAFLKELTPEQGAQFHQLLDRWAHLNAQETEQAFQEGFRLGGKFAIEILSEKSRL